MRIDIARESLIVIVYPSQDAAGERERALTQSRDDAAARADKMLQMQKTTEQVLAAEREKIERQRSDNDSKARSLSEERAENSSLTVQIERLTEANADLQAQYR